MKFEILLVAAAAIFATGAMAQAPADDSILVDDFIITQDVVEAKVVSVKPQARTLTVRGDKRGETREFSVPEGTRITVNGESARLRDIRRGDHVLLKMVPQKDDVIVARVQVPEPATSLQERRADGIVASVTPTMLPKTASSWPAVLLIGVLAMLGAASLRFARRVL